MTRSERALVAIGLLTWIASGIPTLLLFVSEQVPRSPWMILWAAAFLLFGACFWSMTRAERPALGLLLISSALALVVVSLGHSGFEPILLVIAAAVAGGRLPVSGVAGFIAGQTVLLAGIDIMRFDVRALPTVGAWVGFMVFAAITAMIAENERRARDELARANAELQSALALLDVSTRAAERVRIGRDLHDVIGHHLTALSLQLEVASHSPAEESGKHVRRAQAIAKLLLNDVRTVVSDLRAEKPIDLIRALHLLGSAMVKPRVEIEAPESLLVEDPLVAQTALRTLQEVITNASRHSSAERLTIRVGEAEGVLEIGASDDGVGAETVELGHGLLGMRERVEAAGGSLRIRTAPDEGFSLDVRLPLGALE